MLSSQNVVFGSDHEIQDSKVEKQKKDAMLLSDDQCLSHLEQVSMNMFCYAKTIIIDVNSILTLKYYVQMLF